MKLPPIAFAITLASAAIAVAPASAHHSFAMFDSSKEITLKGTVRQFEWGNPHIFVQLLATDANGVAVEWSLQGASVSVLARQGWTRSSIKAGDVITVTLNPLKTGERGGSIVRVKLAGGKELNAALGLGGKGY